MRKLLSIRVSQWVPLIISFLFVINLSLPVSSQNIGKRTCQTEGCLTAANNLKGSMNTNVDPCDDFYKYACGKKLSTKLHERLIISKEAENFQRIADFLKQNNSNDEPEAVHKARKFFSLCSNEAAHNNTLESIGNILEKIGLSVSLFMSNETENYDYNALLARSIRLANVGMYFNLRVNPDPYNRTENMITLTKGTITKAFGMKGIVPFPIIETICEDQNSNFCTQFKSVQSHFVNNSLDEEIINQHSEIVKITEKPRSTLKSSVINVYTLKQLQDLTNDIAAEVNATIPTLNWTRYIEEMFTDLDNVTLDLSDPNKIRLTILEMEAIKEMIQLVHKSKSIKMIVLGLWWEVIFSQQQYVYSSKSHISTCSMKTGEIFGMAVSYLYATKEKFINAKTELRAMLEHIKQSFQQIIQKASWMDEMTKQRALKKLQSLNAYIGYPGIIKLSHRFLNDIYNDVQITDNFYDTIISLYQNRIKKNLKKINQINVPHKDHEWTISAHEVYTKYDPTRNSIFLPAGFLGSSVFVNTLHALDYGGLGSVIGHEMAHGFDNFGRRFNEIGNLENWWQPETERIYREKAKCFNKGYSDNNSISHDITRMGDSKLTLGEDLSDNTGFKEALFAYRKCVYVNGEEPFLPQFGNFTHEQLLTLAFANVWCDDPFQSDRESIDSDFRSPNVVHVNAVLRNSKEFSEIWKCSKGSNMNPSDEKCSLW